MELTKFSAHVPSKLLWLLLSCSAVGFIGTLLSLADAFVAGGVMRILPTLSPALTLSGLGAVYLAKVLLDRRKAKAMADEEIGQNANCDI